MAMYFKTFIDHISNCST